MGLESGTYVQDLVTTNPVGATDERRFGDDHLRLLKTVLKNTLPEGNQALRFLRHETRAIDVNFALADKGKHLTATAVFTQNTVSAATLGNGWWVHYRNGATGPIQMNMTINGVFPFMLYPGEEIVITTDGTSFFGLGVPTKALIETKLPPIGTSAAFINLSNAKLRFREFMLDCEWLQPVTDIVEAHLQASTDNGSSWISSGYQWVRQAGLHTGGVSAAGAVGDSVIRLSAENPNAVQSTGRVYINFGTGRVRWEMENTPNNATLAVVSGWGSFNTLVANAIRLFFSSGNIDAAGGAAAIRLYGVN